MKSLPLVLILTLLLQSCSPQFFSGLERKPSSEEAKEVEIPEEIKSFFKSSSLFKEKILGKDIEPNCSPPQLEEEFQRVKKYFKKNSCSISEIELQKESVQKNYCKTSRKAGEIEKFSSNVVNNDKKSEKWWLTRQKDNAADVFFNTSKKIEIVDFNSYHQEAKNLNVAYKVLVSKYNNLAWWFALTTVYHENVLFPLRDLAIARQQYSSNPREELELVTDLQVTISAEYLKGVENAKAAFRKYKEQLSTLFNENPQLKIVANFLYGTDENYHIGLKFIPDSNSNSSLMTFDTKALVGRDVKTLLKAPTPKNYLLSMKWLTMDMMLTQMSTYNAILENKSVTKIPLSCQNHFNGNLSEQIKIDMDPGFGEEALERFLISMGLSGLEKDDAYIDYYLHNISQNPDQPQAGAMSFEGLKSIKQSLVPKELRKVEPQFDDRFDYETFINQQMPKIVSVFRTGVVRERRRMKEVYEATLPGDKTFSKIMKSYNENNAALEMKLRNESGKKVTIKPQEKNLSEFLVELMQEKGVQTWQELLSEQLQRKMKNTVVRLNFPSMYSNNLWREWGLKSLANALYRIENAPRNSPIFMILQQVCEKQVGFSYVPNSLGNSEKVVLNICKSENPLVELSKALSYFRNTDNFISTSEIEKGKFESLYPLMNNLWIYLRDLKSYNTDKTSGKQTLTNLLPEAITNEFEFMTSQMEALNPFARMRLGYLIANEQLENKLNKNDVSWFSKIMYNEDEEKECSATDLKTRLNNIRKASSFLGIDRPLSNNHITNLLNDAEKTELWEKLADNKFGDSMQLLQTKMNGKELYDLLYDISTKNILTYDQAVGAAGVFVNPELKQNLKILSEKIPQKLSSFYFDLYKLKGNTEKQIEIYLQFLKKNGLDEKFNVKANFFITDISYKRLIYVSLVKKAIELRRVQLNKKLEYFCGLNVDNIKNVKEIFYSTSKTQNEINKILGVPAVPPEILSKVNDLDSHGWTIAGMIGLQIGSMIALASCGSTGPLGCGLIGLAGIAGTVVSTGYFVKTSFDDYEHYLESNEKAAKVTEMEELNYAKIASNEEVKESLGGVIFGAVSMIPIYGMTAKALISGERLSVLSSRTLMRATGEASFKNEAKKVLEELSISDSLNFLRAKSESTAEKSFALEIQAIRNELMETFKLFQNQVISESKYYFELRRLAEIESNIIKKYKGQLGRYAPKDLSLSPREVDQLTAGRIAEYFNNSPLMFKNLIDSYARRVDGAVESVAKINLHEISEYWGPFIFIPKGSHFIKEKFINLRKGELAINAKKIKKIQADLLTLSEDPGSLSKFIENNIEDLTDIFLKIPMRKRDILYLFTVQGSPRIPYLYGGKGGKNVLLIIFSEGQITKKFFQARSILVHEARMTLSRKKLGLPVNARAVNFYSNFKAFQKSLLEYVSKISDVEREAVFREYAELEKKIVEVFYLDFRSRVGQMSIEEFRGKIISPANLDDSIFAQSIWESQSHIEEVLKLKELPDLAHKASLAISKTQTDTDSYQNLLALYRMTNLIRNPEILDP